MRTRYGECVIEVLDDGGPFADQAYSECVGKTGKRLLDNVDKGNADGKYTKRFGIYENCGVSEYVEYEPVEGNVQ